MDQEAYYETAQRGPKYILDIPRPTKYEMTPYRLCRQDKKSVNMKFNNFRSEYPLQSCVSTYPARFPCSFR